MPEIIRIDADTWRIEDDFVRFFLLEGKQEAVLIDSGANCPDAAEIAKKLTEKPVILLNTHGDGDHTSGTAGFPVIRMHAADYKNQGLDSRYPNTQLKELVDGELIDPGDRPLRMIHIPGHTYGSIAILDSKKRILYAGDSVQKGHIYMFGSHRDTESFEKSLDKLIALQPEYDAIYASHDEYLLPADYAEKVKAAWMDVRGGKLSYEKIELHGNEVKSYTAEACGFYC